MSEHTAENDAHPLRQHVRLTALDKPYACSCEPDVRDCTQSWTDHAVAVLTSVTPPGRGN